MRANTADKLKPVGLLQHLSRALAYCLHVDLPYATWQWTHSFVLKILSHHSYEIFVESEKQYFGFPVALNQNDQNEHKLRPEDITVCVTNLYNIQ